MPLRIGFIGAGANTLSMHIPGFKKSMESNLPPSATAPT